MADFSNIENQIDSSITTNGVGAITGAILNAILKGMLSAVDTAKQDTLTFDTTPTEDSTKPVTSGGVYDALDAAAQAVATALADYYTKTQTDNMLATKADKNAVVHLTGDQTIAGVKSFYDQPIFAEGVKLDNQDDRADIILSVSKDEDNQIPKLTLEGYIGDNPELLLLDGITNSGDSVNEAVSIGYLNDALAAKQDTIGDLATIRSGAAAGATAVQPATMQTALDAKADKVAKATTMPADGFLPNTCYELGEIAADTTFALAAATDNTIANVWWWSFEMGATLYNVNMPAGVTEWAGGSAPTLAANKRYEITVKDGLGAYIES